MHELHELVYHLNWIKLPEPTPAGGNEKVTPLGVMAGASRPIGSPRGCCPKTTAQQVSDLTKGSALPLLEM